jgi:RNA polymerase-interacting CarD/CdnL/TRCF family regulator
MPLMEKRQKLREIEQMNPVVADLIRKQMGEVTKEQDRQFIMQGRQMMQQQGGAPPPM